MILEAPMRTTLGIEEKLLEEVKALSGGKNKERNCRNGA